LRVSTRLPTLSIAQDMLADAKWQTFTWRRNGQPWQRERYQRLYMPRLVCSGDLVIISDADEIVRREVTVTAEQCNEFCFLRMQLYCYCLDLYARSG
jgi:hypothetical protein